MKYSQVPPAFRIIGYQGTLAIEDTMPSRICAISKIAYADVHERINQRTPAPAKVRFWVAGPVVKSVDRQSRKRVKDARFQRKHKA